jgi:hypothetical protein
VTSRKLLILIPARSTPVGANSETIWRTTKLLIWYSSAKASEATTDALAPFQFTGLHPLPLAGTTA